MNLNQLISALLVIQISILMYICADYKKRILNQNYLIYLIKEHKSKHGISFKQLMVLYTASFILMFVFKQLFWIVLNVIFSVYMFYHYALEGYETVKRLKLLKEIKGCYVKSKTLPKEKYDLVTNMNNGHRTDKLMSVLILDYLTQCNDETVEVFTQIFGPNGLVYDQGKEKIRRGSYVSPYDYQSECGLNKISNEFFDFLKETTFPEQWLSKVLSLFNQSYASGHSDYKLDNLIRIIGHILEKDHPALFSSSVCHLLNHYIQEAINEKPREEMRAYRTVKEQYLLKSFEAYTQRNVTISTLMA